MNSPIPPDLWERIKAFCASGKTGQIVLDAKEGRILAWKITESGRVADTLLDTKALLG